MAPDLASFSENEKQGIFDRLNRIDVLDGTMNVRVGNLEGLVGGIQKDLKDIKENLMARPTWLVTMIISALGCISVTLFTILISMHTGVTVTH